MKKLTILSFIFAISVLSGFADTYITSDNISDYKSFRQKDTPNDTYIFSGNVTVSSDTQWDNSYKMRVESNANVSFNSWQNLLTWSAGRIWIEDDSSLFARGGLSNAGIIEVSGSLNVGAYLGTGGKMGVDNKAAFSNRGTIVFNTNSSFLSEFVASDSLKYLNLVGGNVNVMIGSENKYIKFADYVVFNNTKLTLDSSNVIISGYGRNSAQTQADSIFILANCANNVWSKSDVVVDVNMANEFGAFKFYNGSSLTLDLTGLLYDEAFVVNKLEGLTVTDGVLPHKSIDTVNSDAIITLNLNLGEDFQKLQIGNLYSDFTKEENGERILSNLAVNFYNEDTKAYDIAGVLGENFFISENGWLTTTPIPEPSTYAVIFGALALGFVAYRKRK